MYSLMRELSKRHEVYLVSFTGGEYPHSVDQLKRYCRDFRLVKWEWEKRAMPATLLPETIWRGYRRPGFTREMESLLISNSIDLVAVEYTNMALYRPEGYPSVLTVHELQIQSAYQSFRYGPVRKKWRLFREMLKWLYFELKNFSLFDRVVVLTEKEKRILQRFSPRLKVSVIPTGADAGYFFPRPDEEKKSDFVFVGNFTHQPNVDAMRYFCVDILPRIRKRVPDARITIVGYESHGRLEDLEGLEGVDILGRVEDIRPCLAAGRIFVNPVRAGAGIRGKLLEAFGMALPVVSTRLGAQGLEEHSGRCFIMADTPEDFAREAVALLGSEAPRRRLGNSARQLLLSGYDWKILGARLAEIYESVLNNWMRRKH